MKKIYLLFITLAGCLLLNAQDVSTFCNVSSCYQKDSCYADAAIQKQDYTYARVGNIFGNNALAYKRPLTMSVYSACALPAPGTVPYNPASASAANVTPTCTGCKRPFILLIHGGGFNDGCRDNLEEECREFARRGYVAATIDYRLGWISSMSQCYTNLGTHQFCPSDTTLPIPCPTTSRCTDTDSLHAAMYKAIQDAQAALRYIAYYAANFNIDPNYFYVGGQSAGSIVATNLTYMNQNELNTLFSKLVVNGNNIYGKINNSGNSLQASFLLKGLYNCWGAVGDSNAIRAAADRIPVIAFHCKNDPVVPYGHGYSLQGACKTSLDTADGSSAIFKQLKNKYPNPGGVATEFYHQDTGGHGGILTHNDAENLKRIELAVCFFRKCRMGYTAQVEYDLTNGDNTTVECSLSNSNVRTALKTQPLAEKITEPVISLSGRSIISRYTLIKNTMVEIAVYDMAGRQLNAYKKMEETGAHQNLMRHSFTSGMYIVTIRYNGKIAHTRKLAIIN